MALTAALPQLRRGEDRAEVGAAHGEHQAMRLKGLWMIDNRCPSELPILNFRIWRQKHLR